MQLTLSTQFVKTCSSTVLQCGKDEEDAQTAARMEYLQIYVMSSQTSLGQFIEGASVFYIYSLLIIYLASNVRAMFSGVCKYHVLRLAPA